jgi:hypothetical protein
MYTSITSITGTSAYRIATLRRMFYCNPRFAFRLTFGEAKEIRIFSHNSAHRRRRFSQTEVNQMEVELDPFQEGNFMLPAHQYSLNAFLIIYFHISSP